jgi:hypothetical protein
MGESLRQVGDSSGAARADSVATAITRALRPTAR